MSAGLHTPGPWFSKREGFSTVYIEARIGGGMIQEIAACGPTAEGSEQQEANATLIASAPDLLAERDRLKAANAELAEALQKMLDAYDDGVTDWEKPYQQAARAALTKAREL